MYLRKNYCIWAIWLLLVLISNKNGYAQNVGFSQYHYTPTLTNPASVASKSEMSALLNFRQQRIAAGQNYTTPMVSFVYPFIKKREKTRLGGMGISVLNETTGQNNFFRTTGVLAGLGYNLPVAENYFFAFGLQGGYIQRVIDAGNVTTEELFFNGFDPTIGNGEPLSSYQDGFPLVNSGLIFYKEDENQTIPFQLGVALYNMNRPDVSFFGQVDRIPMSVQVSGEARVFQNEFISIHPTFRWWQRTQVNQLNIGGMMKYHFAGIGNIDFVKEGHIGFNLWYNLNKVAIIGVQIEQPAYVFGFSYDFAATSNIPVREVNNAFEFTLGWRKIFDTKRKKPSYIRNNNLPPKEENNNNVVENGNRVEKVEETTVIIRKPIEVVAPQKELSLDALDKEILQRNIYFNQNSSDLSDNNQKHLDEVAILLDAYPALLYKLTGYKYKAESAELCLYRANAIRNYLVRKGVNEDRIIIDVAPKAEAEAVVKPTLLR